MPNAFRNHDAHDYAECIRERLPRRLQELWELCGLSKYGLARNSGISGKHRQDQRLLHLPNHGRTTGRPTQHTHASRRSSALFGNSIRGGRRLKKSFEVLAKAGDVAVADAFGDAGDG